jgi:hypothetical protein
MLPLPEVERRGELAAAEASSAAAAQGAARKTSMQHQRISRLLRGSLAGRCGAQASPHAAGAMRCRRSESKRDEHATAELLCPLQRCAKLAGQAKQASRAQRQRRSAALGRQRCSCSVAASRKGGLPQQRRSAACSGRACRSALCRRLVPQLQMLLCSPASGDIGHPALRAGRGVRRGASVG